MDLPISPSICVLIKGQLSTRYLSHLRQRYGADIPVYSLSDSLPIKAHNPSYFA
jgi:hypothetical protein